MPPVKIPQEIVDEAQQLVNSGMTPQAAADQLGLNINTLRKRGVTRTGIRGENSAYAPGHFVRSVKKHIYFDVNETPLRITVECQVLPTESSP